MHLWKTGEQSQVDGYLNKRGLWKSDMFASVVQAVLEIVRARFGGASVARIDSESPAQRRADLVQQSLF